MADLSYALFVVALALVGAVVLALAIDAWHNKGRRQRERAAEDERAAHAAWADARRLTAARTTTRLASRPASRRPVVTRSAVRSTSRSSYVDSSPWPPSPAVQAHDSAYTPAAPACDSYGSSSESSSYSSASCDRGSSGGDGGGGGGD